MWCRIGSGGSCRPSRWMSSSRGTRNSDIDHGSMASFLCCGCYVMGLRFASTASSAGSRGGDAQRSDYDKTIHSLLQRCHDLEAMVAQRDGVIRQLLPHAPAAGLVPSDVASPSACVVVSTDKELEDAMRNHVSVIALTEGRHYVLLPQPFRLRDTSVAIIGRATIEGSLYLVNSTLDATDTTFVAPGASYPAIDVSGARGSVRLTNCTLTGGRDGLYMSNGSRAMLRGCCIKHNTRGVFEGLGCELTSLHSTYDGNWFHALLLGNPRHERARAFFPKENPVTSSTACRAVTACENIAVPSDATRADIVLRYNPMEDVYSDVLRGGYPVVLTAEDSTAGLCDPTW